MLRGDLQTSEEAQLDKTIKYSPIREYHEHNLRNVINPLKENQLLANQSDCKLYQSGLPLWWHIFSA